LLLNSSQFLLLTQHSLKTTLALKVVKIDLEKNHLSTRIQIGETDCSRQHHQHQRYEANGCWSSLSLQHTHSHTLSLSLSLSSPDIDKMKIKKGKEGKLGI
jgi:hypothetical protein